MTLHPVSQFSRAILCLALGMSLPSAMHGSNTTYTADAPALKTQGPRTSGPVSVSLQNEVNAAIDRGREWLMAQQNADGSWGTNSWSTNYSPRVKDTALATLALLHDATAPQRAAALRGAHWLTTTPASETSDELPTTLAAWRLLALRVAATMDTSITVPLVTAKSVAVGLMHQAITPMHGMLLRELGLSVTNKLFNSFSDDLMSKCMLAMAQPSDGTQTHLLSQVAARWPAFRKAFAQEKKNGHALAAWVFARYINRAGGGTLADANGTVVDWRNDLAVEFVSSQTMDANGGGGFWGRRFDPSSPIDQSSSVCPNPITETAFALLALDEL